MRRSTSIITLFSVLFLAVLAPPLARAQNQGFQIGRYEPTPAGERSFWIDHPWYSGARRYDLAAGLSLNYGHRPLVFGRLVEGRFEPINPVISHQMFMHLDLSGSFLDRVLLSATLPILLSEGGQEFGGVKPLSGGTVSDPRLGFMARLYNQPERDSFSIHFGAHFWIPLRKFTDGLPAQASDQELRVLPKAVVAGRPVPWLRYSATLGFLIRQDAVLGDLSLPEGRSVGSEVQFGGSAYYINESLSRRFPFSIGPELLLSTVMTGGSAFKQDFTALEILLGGHVHVYRMVLVGMAFGFGALREPGTPDFRWLLRLAWAPERGAVMARPEVLVAASPKRGGKDRDRDGVHDADDLCPDEPRGSSPDIRRLGCPLPDRDRDGVPDAEDVCPDVHDGGRTDSLRLGCPMGDKDRDGVLDGDDRCPDVPQGLHPDQDQIGCPLPDRDKDSVVDAVDACPDEPGAPHPDPRRNGCRGLVQVKDGKVQILRPVYFATNRDVILQKSNPVLQAVADALTAQQEIRKMAIEGHTDNRGAVEYNTDLSARRARSVLRWLVQHGIDEKRLEAHGLGPTRPIQDNKTEKGRAANRRVDFVILDPASDSAAPASGKGEAP